MNAFKGFVKAVSSPFKSKSNTTTSDESVDLKNGGSVAGKQNMLREDNVARKEKGGWEQALGRRPSASEGIDPEEYEWDLQNISIPLAIEYFYTQYAPNKLSSMDKVLIHYKGAEMQLLRELCVQYHVSQSEMSSFLDRAYERTPSMKQSSREVAPEETRSRTLSRMRNPSYDSEEEDVKVPSVVVTSRPKSTTMGVLRISSNTDLASLGNGSSSVAASSPVTAISSSLAQKEKEKERKKKDKTVAATCAITTPTTATTKATATSDEKITLVEGSLQAAEDVGRKVSKKNEKKSPSIVSFALTLEEDEEEPRHQRVEAPRRSSKSKQPKEPSSSSITDVASQQQQQQLQQQKYEAEIEKLKAQAESSKKRIAKALRDVSIREEALRHEKEQMVLLQEATRRELQAANEEQKKAIAMIQENSKMISHVVNVAQLSSPAASSNNPKSGDALLKKKGAEDEERQMAQGGEMAKQVEEMKEELRKTREALAAVTSERKEIVQLLEQAASNKAAEAAAYASISMLHDPMDDLPRGAEDLLSAYLRRYDEPTIAQKQLQQERQVKSPKAMTIDDLMGVSAEEKAALMALNRNKQQQQRKTPSREPSPSPSVRSMPSHRDEIPPHMQGTLSSSQRIFVSAKERVRKVKQGEVSAYNLSDPYAAGVANIPSPKRPMSHGKHVNGKGTHHENDAGVGSPNKMHYHNMSPEVQRGNFPFSSSSRASSPASSSISRSSSPFGATKTYMDPKEIEIEQQYKLTKQYIDLGLTQAQIGQRLASRTLKYQQSLVDAEHGKEKARAARMSRSPSIGSTQRSLSPSSQRSSSPFPHPPSPPPPPPPPSPSFSSAFPDDWVRCFDKNTRKYYYYSASRAQSAWTVPTSSPLSVSFNMQASAQAQARSRNGSPSPSRVQQQHFQQQAHMQLQQQHFSTPDDEDYYYYDDDYEEEEEEEKGEAEEEEFAYLGNEENNAEFGEEEEKGGNSLSYAQQRQLNIKKHFPNMIHSIDKAESLKKHRDKQAREISDALETESIESGDLFNR